MRAFKILMSLPLVLAWAVPLHAQEVLTGAAAFGTWQADAPGVRRHITPADLPQPTLIENDPEAPDFERAADVVPAPEGKLPTVPAGFDGEGLRHRAERSRVSSASPPTAISSWRKAARARPGLPRRLGRERAGNAGGLRRGPRPAVRHRVLSAADPRFVYVAAANQVVRYPYKAGDRKATAPAEIIIPDIPTQRHWTRDLAVSPDGQRLFVSIGSSSNVAAAMPEKTEDEIKTFEKTHGLGAAWGDEENRAVVRVFDPEGENVRNYATGLRNCSGMTMQPGTDTLWCTGNERDHIGPNLVPDFLTTVKERRVLRLALVLHRRQRGSGPCRRAPRPQGQGHRARRADPGAFVDAAGRLLRRRRVPGRVQGRCLRHPARLLEPRRPDRIQGDPRPHGRRQANRRL